MSGDMGGFGPHSSADERATSSYPMTALVLSYEPLSLRTG